MTEKTSIAIVGATGLVGNAIVESLNESSLTFDRLFCLATGESVGEEVELKGKFVPVKQLDDFDFSQVNVAIFATPQIVTERYVSRALNKNCRVVRINQTSVGLNEEQLAKLTIDQLGQDVQISSPFINMLKPIVEVLDEENGISALDITLSLPAASKGKSAVEELAQQTVALFNSQDVEVAAFPVRAAFNTIPHVGRLDSCATSSFEIELENSIASLLEEEATISVFASHVPVFYGATAKIVIDLKYPLETKTWKTLLETADQLSIIDEAKPGGYMTPVDAVGKEQVFVSRVRQVSESRCICYLALDPVANVVKTVVNLLELIEGNTIEE
ncbi:hypothetical protein LIN78_17015 [Leeia sp. TBRC 13508]|uniref:Semialdehyde dehydrogenase NAD-binding domain-containing protein n=1 Tax=Leeia speluncae TaxID=2884804 RepID=A0ABS8DAL5_9NEIS|nr:Asd/ArgC dimerization domain-containing protein [Leeia speluncae]MCB6185250.1 hypothetical protein [Leeia speluncae]